jgi:hypothetical protein
VPDNIISAHALWQFLWEPNLENKEVKWPSNNSDYTFFIDTGGGRNTKIIPSIHVEPCSCRLTPVYAIVLMFFTCVYPLFRSGPSFPEIFLDYQECETSWWVHLLYLNNIIDIRSNFVSDLNWERLSLQFIISGQCMGWTWSLANDFQFHCIAPLFIFLLVR